MVDKPANNPRASPAHHDRVDRAVEKMKSGFRRVSARFGRHRREASEESMQGSDTSSDGQHARTASSSSDGSSLEEVAKPTAKALVLSSSTEKGSPVRRVRQRLSSLTSRRSSASSLSSTTAFPLPPQHSPVSSPDSPLPFRKKRVRVVSTDSFLFFSSKHKSMPASPPPNFAVVGPEPAIAETSAESVDELDPFVSPAEKAEEGVETAAEAHMAEAVAEAVAPASAERDAPDQFLIEDPDEPEPVTPAPFVRAHESVSPDVPAAEEVSIASPPSPTVDVNKPVPRPPVSEPEPETESEPEVPALYLPQLVAPTMFLPIPNTDPLTTLLTKYVPNPEKRPPRDTAGEYARADFHTLVMTNSWRALARMARDRIVQTDPEDLDRVFNLWYLRLASLARLRLFNQTSAELSNLFSALATVPRAALDRVLPFELEVLYARVPYWSGDAPAYADALAQLLRTCRLKARRARNAGDRQMWVERGARLGLIAASNFIETKDYATATALLEPLLAQPKPAPALRAALGRVYLQAGQLSAAASHFELAVEDPDVPESAKKFNAALLATARGEPARAEELLREVVQQDAESVAAVNGLAVVLFSEGKIKEAIDVLERALHAAPASLAMAEPFLFNLSTLYELRSAVAADKKRELLVEVAKWSGDGLRTTCLKLPTS